MMEIGVDTDNDKSGNDRIFEVDLFQHAFLWPRDELELCAAFPFQNFIITCDFLF